MYGITNRIYGVVLRDLDKLKVPLAFIKKLAALDPPGDPDDPDQNVENWPDGDFDDMLTEFTGVKSSYSGDTDSPCYIGIDIDEAADFDVQAVRALYRGEDALDLTDIKHKWDSEISKEIRELLTEFGIEPKVDYFHSTS
jgi:hypothetical protein